MLKTYGYQDVVLPSQYRQRSEKAQISRQNVVCHGRFAAKRAPAYAKSNARKTKNGTMVAKMIRTAVKEGGEDPSNNPALRKALDLSKKLSVSSDVVQRALKGTGEETHEYLFELYGKAGTGYLVICETVKKHTAKLTINAVVKNQLAKFASEGSVLFGFNKVGQIAVPVADEEKAMEIALEAEAEDVAPWTDQDEPKGHLIFCSFGDFGKVRDAVTNLGHEIDYEKSGIVYQPLSLVVVDKEEDFDENTQLYEQLLELDSVQQVFTNCSGIYHP